jgi:phage terminase large subunit-like protein
MPQSPTRSVSWAARTVVKAAEAKSPTFWAQRHFHIEDRSDPVTGAPLGPGPIVLAAHQERIIEAALERDSAGRFRWSTVLWSCPKKSGKTRIAAMVAAWLAQHSDRYAEIYCLANDGKQSADRVLAAVKKANELGGLGWHDKMTRIELPGGAFIEAVPVDPTGEAGANPTASIWSEMWGFRLSAKERLWSEFTIPPTRFGRAVRWVESYAGYTGESPVLEQLYHEGVEEGKPHPAFPDLPVYTNDRARLFAYWDHEPRMAWQTREYYEAEAALLHPSEFQRIHRNEWVSAIGQAIQVESWDRCHDPQMPPLRPDEPVVLGLDAGVSGDCTALVVVGRHPRFHDIAAIRAVEVWEPPAGGQMDYTTTIEASVRKWCKQANVVCVTFDPYQLHKMCTDLRREGLGWFEEFNQGAQRAIADKQMVDLVTARKMAHNGDATLRQHVINAAAKTEGEKSLRFVKRSDKLKIDALVAASMGVFQVLRLNL